MISSSTAAILFALAAVGGAFLAWLHLQGRDVSVGVALAHGILGAAGLVVLLLVVLEGGASGILTVSFAIFVVAALGGFVLFANHLKGRPLEQPMILMHGGAAVVAFLVLLYAILGGG